MQQRCVVMGEKIMAGLRGLQEEVRASSATCAGKGLMIGVELVKDRTTKEPAREAECAQVFETTKDMGLLIGKGGLYGSILRIKPPMCITDADVDFMIEVLDAVPSPQLCSCKC